MAALDRLTTVISTKGQVILPKPIRDQRHWAPGTRLSVENTPDGVMLRPVASFPSVSVDQVFGMLGHAAPVLSLEDMDAAIATEAKRRVRD